jgi:hypothetical protein
MNMKSKKKTFWTAKSWPFMAPARPVPRAGRSRSPSRSARLSWHERLLWYTFCLQKFLGLNR